MEQPLRKDKTGARNARLARVGNSYRSTSPSRIALLALLVVELMVSSVSGASEDPTAAAGNGPQSASNGRRALGIGARLRRNHLTGPQQNIQ